MQRVELHRKIWAIADMCVVLLKVGILNNTYCIWAIKKLEMVDDKGIQEYTNGVFG
ncbi:MAG: hypothetical protein E7G18_05745 [Anaerococcus hydrogenalis]|uniref:hypothetical protein n=1 Tax=Anaerococcus hydrogenalis TaxID=33029 RepID=UPI0029067232|nr:hypothetical protein [Anaerococcus hydrogenalis]MDU3688171.1 hypothetical protein [Anaerococcus hydrogenalis]